MSPARDDDAARRLSTGEYVSAALILAALIVATAVVVGWTLQARDAADRAEGGASEWGPGPHGRQDLGPPIEQIRDDQEGAGGGS